jgi:integrase
MPRVERVKLPPKPQRKPFNRKSFTERNVLQLSPKKGKQYMIWDEGTNAARGLAVLVSPTGTKSYRCVYYFPGSPKPHYKHLGRVGEMTLEQARQLTRKARGDARQGLDPRADDPSKADSFESAVERYIEDRQKARKGNKSADETKAVMLNNCKDWLPRSVATIRGAEVDHLLLSIRKGSEGSETKKPTKPRPYLANRLYSHLKDFFSWAARPNIGFIKVSPMVGVELPFDKAAPRNLSWFKNDAADAAIKALWQVASEVGGNEGRYIKTMLLLGKRKTALASMKWDEIDATWFWNAPPSNSNKKLFAVPLSSLAQRVLHPHQQSGLVFGHIDLDRLQRTIRDKTNLKDFIWHGIRHLCETKTADLGIPPHIRDLLFDHVSERGSGRGYDHAEYRAAMREATEAWAAYVGRLVGPEGVAVLR